MNCMVCVVGFICFACALAITSAALLRIVAWLPGRRASGANPEERDGSGCIMCQRPARWISYSTIADETRAAYVCDECMQDARDLHAAFLRALEHESGEDQ